MILLLRVTNIRSFPNIMKTIIVAVLSNYLITAAHAIDILDCEGKATYNLQSGLLTLPFVNFEGNSVSASLNLISGSNPIQFSLRNLTDTQQTEWPNSRPCHSEQNLSFGDTILSIPVLTLDKEKLNFRVELSYLPETGNFRLNNVQPIQLARLEPLFGSYFGVNLDWGVDTVAGITEKLGFSPNVFVHFTHFPLVEPWTGWLDEAVVQIKDQNSGAILLLTLEPHDGLKSSITADALDVLKQRLQVYNDLGVPVLVRFAHEMNGSWYPWGQQPQAYIEAFRAVANVVHQTTKSAMLWAPNYGGDYPYSGGQYQSTPDLLDFSLLDTNKDGKLDQKDDPYAPYYPGDDVVDWVGVSLYHWGNLYPWYENEISDNNKFVSQLTGRFIGDGGDNEQSTPNFYYLYSESKNKPFAITETAALYLPNESDSSPELERLVKQLWWRQIFSPEVNQIFPNIKMVNWFEWRKSESELGGKIVNWRITGNEALTESFVEDLRRSYFGFY